MKINFSSAIFILKLFVLLISYIMVQINFDLILCLTFVLLWQNQLILSQLYLENYLYCTVSVSLCAIDAY